MAMLFKHAKGRVEAQASTEWHAWASALDLCHRVDEVDPVAVVLRQACCNGQDIAVENNILEDANDLLSSSEDL